MIFILNREVLTPCLTVLTAIAAKKTASAIFKEVLVTVSPETIQMITTDGDLEVSVQLPCDTDVNINDTEAFTVPVKKLNDIVKGCPKQSDITFTVDNKNVTLVSKRSKYKLYSMEASNFPASLNEIASNPLSIPSDLLMHCLSSVFPAIASDDVRHYLNGAYVSFNPDGAIVFVGSDGHRLNVIDEQQDPQSDQATVPGFSCIIPKQCIQQLGKIAKLSTEMQISYAQNRITFQAVADDMVVSLSSSLIDGTYPSHKGMVPDDAPVCFSIAADALKQAVNRAMVLSHTNGGVQLSCVKNGDDTELLLRNRNEINETSHIRLSLDKPCLEFKIALSGKYLLDAISAIGSDIVNIHVTNIDKPMMITGEGCPKIGTEYPVCIVAPMKIFMED